MLSMLGYRRGARRREKSLYEYTLALLCLHVFGIASLNQSVSFTRITCRHLTIGRVYVLRGGILRTLQSRICDIQVVHLGAAAQAIGGLFGREIPLGLSHKLEPVTITLRTADHPIHTSLTYPTRNLRTLALRKSGGAKCKWKCATSASSESPGLRGTGRWCMPIE